MHTEETSGTILVTGGTGTLGSHIVRQAAESSAWRQVHATYLTTNPNFHRVFWHYVDARNLITPTLEKIHPTCIIHTMAMTSPDLCEKKKLDAWQVNVKATDEIIDFAIRNSTRLVFASTDLIFDGSKGNYVESDTPSPISFYGDSKVEAENRIRERMRDGRYVIARLSLLYGFNQNQRMNFFDQIRHALESNQSLALYTDQFRTPLCVNAAAQCMLELAISSFEGIVNVGGPERISRYDFGERLAKYLGKSPKPLKPVIMAEVPSPARRPADVSLDTTLVRRLLKTPIPNLEEGFGMIFGMRDGSTRQHGAGKDRTSGRTT